MRVCAKRVRLARPRSATRRCNSRASVGDTTPVTWPLVPTAAESGKAVAPGQPADIQKTRSPGAPLLRRKQGTARTRYCASSGISDAIGPNAARDLVPVTAASQHSLWCAVGHGISTRGTLGNGRCPPTPRKRGREVDAKRRAGRGLFSACRAEFAGPSDDAFLLQRVDILRCETEARREHLGIVAGREGATA